MKNYILYFTASFIILTSCSPDEIDNTSTQAPNISLTKYVKYNLDLTVNPPVPLDSTVYTIVNDRYQKIKIYNSNGSTRSAIFNYVNNRLDHIDYYNDGVINSDFSTFTYDLNGILIGRETLFNNVYLKYRYQKIADTTSVFIANSNDGINFSVEELVHKVVTDNDYKVTYEEKYDTTNNKVSYILYSYDLIGNLILEKKDTDYNNGNLVNDITYDMTYSTIENPISRIRINTYSKYFNNINYSRRSGSVNLTIGPSMISPQQLNTYSYNLFADFPTTITNQTNTNGNIDTITYLTVDSGGNPFTSFTQKFFYQ